jgi:hypothetical protein
MATKNLARSETEDGTWEKLTTTTAAQRIESKSLVLPQINCRRYNKTLDFWNLVDTYTADFVIGTESRLKEEIRKAKVFRADFTTFRTDRRARVGGCSFVLKIAMPALICR